MSIEDSQSIRQAKGKLGPLHAAYRSKCLLSIKIAGRYFTGGTNQQDEPEK